MADGTVPKGLLYYCSSILPWKSTTIKKNGGSFWMMIDVYFKNGGSETKP